jgi:hypothetical protein
MKLYIFATTFCSYGQGGNIKDTLHTSEDNQMIRPNI